MAKEFTSPLKAWEGSFTLPEPDDFSGAHWQLWSAAVNKPKRSSYADSHLFGYAGLEVVARYGEWKFAVGLEEVRSWEERPEAERVKLIAWIGKEISAYMRGIIDPKE